MLCAHCRIEFPPAKAWQKYCSDRCRNLARNAREPNRFALAVGPGTEAARKSKLRKAQSRYARGKLPPWMT